MRLGLLLVVVAACGRGAGTTATSAGEDGGAKALAGAPVEAPTVAPLVLGMPAVDAFGYRKGAGQPAFKRARAGEARGAWTDVVAACREALAADPAHLDAAYLLAVALAKTDSAPVAIIGPLTTAVAGDFVKWGSAALAQPSLQGFLASPLGVAWQARVTAARTQLATILARSIVIGARGDLYAWDRESPRFHRLTRTGGAVVATFRRPGTLLYITRERYKGESKVGVGMIDLASAHSKRIAYVPSPVDKLSVAYNTKLPGFIVYAKVWLALDDSADALALRAIDPKLRAPGYPASLDGTARLDVRGRTSELARVTLPYATADRDDHGLASALRLGTSKRVVTVPSPGMIDTTTLAWSPDRSQVAFVAQLTEVCKPGEPTSAVYVADAATGSARELARASKNGMAIEWVADRTLAIADDQGVAIHTLAGEQPPLTIPGADALAVPRRMPACVAPPVEPAADEPGDDDSEHPQIP